MRKWYKVCVAWGQYRRGDIIAPEGLNRESLQMRGWITRTPVYIGPRKPTAAELAAYAAPAPVLAPEPEPALVADPELDPLLDLDPEPEPEPARRGRPRRHGN